MCMCGRGNHLNRRTSTGATHGRTKRGSGGWRSHTRKRSLGQSGWCWQGLTGRYTQGHCLVRWSGQSRVAIATGTTRRSRQCTATAASPSTIMMVCKTLHECLHEHCTCRHCCTCTGPHAHVHAHAHVTHAHMHTCTHAHAHAHAHVTRAHAHAHMNSHGPR